MTTDVCSQVPADGAQLAADGRAGARADGRARCPPMALSSPQTAGPVLGPMTGPGARRWRSARRWPGQVPADGAQLAADGRAGARADGRARCPPMALSSPQTAGPVLGPMAGPGARRWRSARRRRPGRCSGRWPGQVPADGAQLAADGRAGARADGRARCPPMALSSPQTAGPVLGPMAGPGARRWRSARRRRPGRSFLFTRIPACSV